MRISPARICKFGSPTDPEVVKRRAPICGGVELDLARTSITVPTRTCRTSTHFQPVCKLCQFPSLSYCAVLGNRRMGLVGHSQLQAHICVERNVGLWSQGDAGVPRLWLRWLFGVWGVLDFHLNLFLDRLRCVGLPVWYCLL